jgi:hypothetical protein
MNKIFVSLILLLTGCNYSAKLQPIDTKVSRSVEMQKEIDSVLAKDAENKKLEKEYLEEIRRAEENNDQEAFKFYLSEYVKVQRLKLPQWIKKEPNYVEGGVNIKY